MVAIGPEIIAVRSRTRTPSKGPGISDGIRRGCHARFGWRCDGGVIASPRLAIRRPARHALKIGDHRSRQFDADTPRPVEARDQQDIGNTKLLAEKVIL